MHKCLELLSSGKDVIDQRHAFLLRRARRTRSLTRAMDSSKFLSRTRFVQSTVFVLLLSSSCLVQQQFHQQVMFECTPHVCKIPCYPDVCEALSVSIRLSK